MASITQNVKEEVPKAQIEKKLHPSSLQQTQGIKSYSQNVQNLNQDDDIVDIDSHVTDYQPVIDGNCEPDNNLIPQSIPKNIENILGQQLIQECVLTNKNA